MKTKQTVGVRQKDMALTQRYGQIGISAVAAAVRYQGKGNNEILPDDSLLNAPETSRRKELHGLGRLTSRTPRT